MDQENHTNNKKGGPLLEVSDLWVSVNDNQILKGFDLTVNFGEIHAIMGPNGSGKSTLAGVIAGREEYHVERGSILYKGNDIRHMAPEERAREGLFLAFQYPVEIPGVSTANFLKAAVNEIRKHRGQEQMDAVQILRLLHEKRELVELDKSFLNRSINEGFSGGEKKRNEIYQMAVLEPTLAILDETDSGLDIDAMKIVANGVNKLRSDSKAFVVITHYQRLLNYIIPDFVHVLMDGKIVKSGGKALSLQLEEQGYDWVKDLPGQAVTGQGDAG